MLCGGQSVSRVELQRDSFTSVSWFNGFSSCVIHFSWPVFEAVVLACPTILESLHKVSKTHSVIMGGMSWLVVCYASS